MDRRYWPIFLIVLVNFLGGTIVIPSLPLYASRHFGAPESIIPLLNTSYFAAQFVAAPFLGRLSDKYGRLPVLIISQIGTVFSFLLMAVSGSIEMLFLARILDGATGGNVIVAQAYITDISPREQRTRALGLIFMAFGLGHTFGPAVGGVLTAFGDRAPFFVGALISLATVILTWLTLDESLPAAERLARRARHASMRAADIFANAPLVLILLIAFAAQFCMSMLQSTFVLYGQDVLFAREDARFTGLGVGLLLGTMGVGQLVTQVFLIKPVVSGLGERTVVIVGAVVRGLALLALVVLLQPVLVGLLVMLPFAIGSGLMMPSLQSLATTSVSEDVSGGVLGVYGSFASLGIIFGSALSGLAYEAHHTLPYLIGGLILLLTVVPAIALQRHGAGNTPAPIPSGAD